MRRRKESESVERSIISFFFTFFLKLLELVLLGDDERRRLLLLLLEGHSSLLKLRRSKNRRRWNDREKRKSTGAMNFSQRADFFPFLSLSHFSSLRLSGVFLTALSLFTTNASVVLSLEQLSLSAPPPRTRLVERASEREEIDRGENKDFFFSLFFSLSSSSKENEWNASASASVSPESLTRPTQAEREPS